MIAASITETASVGSITFGTGLEELQKMGATHTQTHWQGMGVWSSEENRRRNVISKVFFFFLPQGSGTGCI